MHENACLHCAQKLRQFFVLQALTTRAMDQYDIFLGFAGFFLSFKYIYMKAIVE